MYHPTNNCQNAEDLFKNQIIQYYQFQLMMKDLINKSTTGNLQNFMNPMMFKNQLFPPNCNYMNNSKQILSNPQKSIPSCNGEINLPPLSSSHIPINSSNLLNYMEPEAERESPPPEQHNFLSKQRKPNSQLDITQISSDSKEKQKYFKCPIKYCDKVFPKECNLKDHIRTHTGEKPFKCGFPTCNRSFSQQGNLKKHEKVHLGEKKFICEFPGCGKNFSASYNLKIHYRCHTGEKPYKCTFDECDRSFYDKGNLKYHEKTAHSLEVKSYPFSCEHIGCNLKFKTKKQKLLHHNEYEPECKEEKDSLIRLIDKFKQSIIHLINSFNIDISQIEKFEEYIKLKGEYEETSQKLFDTEYFFSALGEKFELLNNLNVVQQTKDK